ncbi:hypothetical protein [Nocardiopsis sp. NPDC006938]|uniref:hypothetical protein n=1 Tax=Nocardiopsis sp. NPDC006938 TaxID=3364337 RepID=UPI003684A2F4
MAALALHCAAGRWRETGRSTSLIRPPAFAPVTAATTALNGLTPQQLATTPPPAQALAVLDQRFTTGTRYLLVAHHAATEANLIYHQREHCPTLARINLIDTIALSRSGCDGGSGMS